MASVGHFQELLRRLVRCSLTCRLHQARLTEDEKIRPAIAGKARQKRRCSESCRTNVEGVLLITVSIALSTPKHVPTASSPITDIPSSFPSSSKVLQECMSSGLSKMKTWIKSTLFLTSAVGVLPGAHPHHKPSQSQTPGFYSGWDGIRYMFSL